MDAKTQNFAPFQQKHTQTTCVLFSNGVSLCRFLGILLGHDAQKRFSLLFVRLGEVHFRVSYTSLRIVTQLSEVLSKLPPSHSDPPDKHDTEKEGDVQEREHNKDVDKENRRFIAIVNFTSPDKASQQHKLDQENAVSDVQPQASVRVNDEVCRGNNHHYGFHGNRTVVDGS